MEQLKTKEDLLCAFLAYLRNQPMNMLIFKPVELADMRSRFFDLQIRCNYEGSKVIFTIDGKEGDTDNETLILLERLKTNPVILEQDWVLLFCMVILRNSGKLVMNRTEIEKARKYKKIKLNLTYFKAENQFILKYERRKDLILSGVN